MFLEIGPRVEGYLANFLAVQTHPSYCFLLAVDFLGLRRSGFSTQHIDPPQDFPKHVPGHGYFRHLDRDVATMTDNLGSNFD